ncbi:hypothetical protein DXC27_10730 [Ruminococcus sp. OM08-7]|nr:hypothetical protein DXC27_10730 [Ruminococcus sp. OM08-7]
MKDIKIEKSTASGINEVLYNDSFFKRIFKSKYDYYQEGMLICNNYYNKVYHIFCTELSETKASLQKQINNLDQEIEYLKCILIKYKNIQAECYENNIMDFPANYQNEHNDVLSFIQEYENIRQEENAVFTSIDNIKTKYHPDNISDWRKSQW